ITPALDFWLGLRIEKANSVNQKRNFLIVSVIANLGMLAYFKYSGLLVSTFEQMLYIFPYQSFSSLKISFLAVMLPAGISFYTFQTLSYVIDIYRGESHAERNFFKYLSFVAFFPHLVAGPLTRHNQLIPQLSRIAEDQIRP